MVDLLLGFESKYLDVRKLKKGLWELLSPVVYSGRFGRYEVPAGFPTDFASVPRLLWVLFPKSGKWDEAAVVHDWLITHGIGQKLVDITSAQVDAEFRAALKACKVGWLSRWLMWSGVRWAAVLSGVRRSGWLKSLPQLLAVTAAELAPVVGAVWAAIAVF